ncbi:TetR/AcrR family transcriptional regulator [Phycicoccus endophyticus]|nr:TetR/AcrR family transcriptional regulator [Phycicoccus endophyticus]
MEAAILDAAWEEIAERGYTGFTVDAVAARAGTSKAVLYRRWPDKPELARAAIAHLLAADPVVAPDTGRLRDDVLGLLRRVNERRVGVAAALVANLGDFYRDTGTDLGTLRDSASTGGPSAMVAVVERAVRRGEVEQGRVSERIMRLPTDLLRMELLLGAREVDDAVLVEIVDTIFLPLATGGRAQRTV